MTHPLGEWSAPEKVFCLPWLGVNRMRHRKMELRIGTIVQSVYLTTLMLTNATDLV